MCLSGQISRSPATTRTGQPRIEPCPNGSRPQAPWLGQQWYAKIEDVCEFLPWIPNKLGIRCEDVIPHFIVMDEYCSKPPPEVPELDWVALATGGPSFTNLKVIWDWLWINWEQQKWSAYCECIPETTGPAPCPPIAEFGGVRLASFFSGFQLVSRVSAPAGWTTVLSTRRRGLDGVGGEAYVSAIFEDEQLQPIDSLVSQNASVLSEGESHSRDHYGLGDQANRDRVRWMSLWVRSVGNPPLDPAVEYPFDTYVSATFTGTCSNIEGPPPVIVIPDPVEPPPLPDLPGLPAECTINTVCAMLQELMPIVRNMGQLVNVLQRFGLPFAYRMGLVHIGLRGAGTLPVSGLVGIQVDVTANLPPRELEGVPAYVWDVGWMTILAVDGMVEEKRITRDVEIWQPTRIQEAVSIGYFLKDDVEAKITELYPLPY